MKMISTIKNLTPKQVVFILWSSVGAYLLFFWLMFFSVRSDAFGWFGAIPNYDILENPDSDLASKLFSADGKIMGTYFRTNRKHIPFKNISSHVIRALVGTEDERFEDHSGVDMEAQFRMIKGILTFDLKGGGSTITMQLAKNLFEMREDSIYSGPAYGFKPTKAFSIKCKEWITATRLEAAFTKEEIITMYLNTVDFGRGAVGIEAAANKFFSKSAEELEVQEAAVLVGMLKGTHLYNPVSRKENCFNRRNTVFGQMVKSGYLTEEEKDSLKLIPLEIRYRTDNYNDGIAPYFRAVIKYEVMKIAKANNLDLFADGLRIYTTIDSRLQKYAEEAVATHMKSLQTKLRQNWGKGKPWSNADIQKEIRKTPFYKQLVEMYEDYPDSVDIVLNEPVVTTVFSYDGLIDTLLSPIEELEYHKWFLQTGMLSTDAQNGHVKAWVGGIDNGFFPFDHVTSDRQPGSIFKPILYSTAIGDGYVPCSQVLDGPVSVQLPDGKLWEPNAKPTGEMINLKIALARSINNIAANLIRDLTPERVVEHAGIFGIDKKKLVPVHSLALGTSDLSVYDLMKVYTTFVNGGIHIEPIYITRIEDQYGKVIYENTPQKQRVISEMHAYKMVTLLRGSTMISGGTATRLSSEYHLLDGGVNQLGGKTGTTQNGADGWFFGISNRLVTGCWVGGELPSIKFRSGNEAQGSRMAMPNFGLYMQKVYNDRTLPYKKEPFNIPADLTPSIIAREFRCESDTTGSEEVLYLDKDSDSGLE